MVNFTVEMDGRRHWWRRGVSVLLCVVCHLLLLATGCVSRTVAPPEAGDQDPDLFSRHHVSDLGVFPGEEDVLEGRNNPVTPTNRRGRVIDPEESWLNFVQHSQSKSNKKDKKKCNKKRKYHDRLIGLPGPQGAQGPMGPQGPAGALLTKDEILSDFRAIIREAAERRAQILAYENCPSCIVNITQATQPWRPEVEDIYLMPTVPIAFHCKLEADVRIPSKTHIEIKNFQTEDTTGLFKRGRGLDVVTGRFTAPRTAIYQLSANLHIRHKRTSVPVNHYNRQDPPKPKENIKVMICINDLCHNRASLKFISGLESTSRIFTLTVSGLLTLQRNEYVSVFIDNSSANRIFVLTGSDFSGILMGA